MNTDKTTSNAGAGAESAQSSVVKISPEYKLEKVASKDAGRPQLANIKLEHCERFGNCAIATNGRSMAIVPIEVAQGENDKGLISPKGLQASRKAFPAGSVKGRMALNGNIEAGGQVLDRPSIAETRFPNWQVVLPNAKPTFEIGVNPKLLFELAQALGASDEIVRLSFSDNLSPFTVTRATERNNGEYGVLMPGRLS